MKTIRAPLPLQAAVLCGWLLCTPAPAQQSPSAPPRLLEQFTHTGWSALDNGPTDVLSIAQTSDGWLWLAAATGLYRFDGQRYERLDAIDGHALLSSNVRTLYAPPEGGLWVGYRMGGGISHFHSGQARHYAADQGLPGGAITSITRAPDGALWIAARDGLARLDGGRFETIGSAQGLPQRRARQVLFDREGRQWIALQGGVYSRPDTRSAFQPAWPRGDLSGMTLAPDGAVWATIADNYYRMAPAAPNGREPSRPALRGNSMQFDRDGNMWLFHAGGVERRTAGGDAPPQQLELSGGLAQSFLQDREGNVWIGTSAGLDRFRRNRLLTLPLRAQFNHPAIAPATGGGVWAGDRIGALRALGPEGERSSVPADPVSALYRDPDGVLWAGNASAVWRVGRGKAAEATRFALPAEAQSYEVQAMSRAADGGLWVSVVRAGLYLLKDGQWLHHGGLPALPGEPDQFPTSLASEADGTLWAGYIRNRIVRIDGKQVTSFGAEQGLEVGTVLTLYQHGEQLWVGGERGVAWFDGTRFNPLRGRQGEAFRGVSGIARTARGDLWLFGGEGLSRIGADQLALALRQPGVEVEYERFDAQDGLLGAASQLRPMPSLVMADDGLLWMSTSNRIHWIDPSHITRNPVPPQVLVQGVTVGERRYNALPGLELPQSTGSLRIDFTALSLSIPERVRFRYRLDGVDVFWQDPGARRQAFYTNLSPGGYRFRVKAANEDGVWNPQEAELAFVIPPTFAQTVWFKLLCVIGAGAALALLYRWRVRQVTQQLRERIEERADERQRIARALHDTFLQSVQGLMLRVHTLLVRLPQDGEARSLVEKILDQSDQVLAEGRNQVSGLRSVSQYQNDLQRLFGELGQQLREQHAASFVLIVTGQPAALQGEAGEHLYHIGREALLNAFRHASAGCIELELGYGADHLTLQVRDNGDGIAETIMTAGARPGHWGLTGMRERAVKLHTVLELWSRPGMGTAVRVTAPATSVYASKRKHGPLRRWLLREAA
jgi:signal transduction histidine kinase/ligand-binding sensor domain-containing protein